MEKRRYSVPMYQQMLNGERVRRRDVAGIPTRLGPREGTVVGPAVENGRSQWYLPILWDGTAKPELIHIARLLRLSAAGS